MKNSKRFTDMSAAYEFYMRHGGIMTTIIPRQEWEVAWYA
jgi:hypothetical protein